MKGQGNELKFEELFCIIKHSSNKEVRDWCIGGCMSNS